MQKNINNRETCRQRNHVCSEPNAPSDPKVYYQLAKAHYELEDFRLAEQVALKGVSYAHGDNTEQKRFWLLLADIRTKKGDKAGAIAARKQADRY